ncbi:MAG: exo-alpha-sialidase [Deltaproteobacteria bacterium]|nr:exo-alpha-sialidase [Deltaproteobacteria bacterium]
MYKLFILSILISCVGYADQPLLSLDGGEVDIVREGTKLWNDKDYLATEWPSGLKGQIFVRSSRNASSIKVLKEGYLLVVTPTYGQRGGFSEENTLKKAGFSRVDIKTFLPFKGAAINGDTCCVYQKMVEPGDTYVRKYEYGITLWREEPLPLVKNKALINSKVASRITPPNPPNAGILFVDHSKNNRSGHLGHALVEYEDGKILAFYPNCSDDNGGHSAVGWMEFKRSLDGGQTWGSPQVLAFSKELFESGQGKSAMASKELFESGQGKSAMAEKAVLTDQGEIVLFYLICDISENPLWQPYWMPLFSKSADGGKTWSDPKPLCSTRGRVYDAVYHNGEIMILHFANDATVSWTGTTKDHVYEFYVSDDGGETFYRRSILPFNTLNRGYGSLGFLEDGKMIAYVYNRSDEYNLDYITSADGGRTWSGVNTAYFSRKIRNPQFIAFDGKYYMHGRSGAYGEGSGNMILYMSDDGVHWDNGVYLRMREAGAGAYSNSIVVGSKNNKTKNRLLIQASHAYKGNMTNILHWWVD